MAALHKLRADAMRGIVVALVVAGLRVAGARRNVASRETEEGKGLDTLHLPCDLILKAQDCLNGTT